jgi:hypothetical protein
LSNTYIVIQESNPCNMIFRKLLSFVLAGIALFLVPLMLPSCTHDPVGIESFDPICFNTQVMPVLISSCNHCHNPNDAANYKEGFNVLDSNLILDMAKTSGSPRSSALYQIITDINSENFMPPDPYDPMPKDSRTIIEVWIAQGGLRVMCDSTGKVKN